MAELPWVRLPPAHLTGDPRARRRRPPRPWGRGIRIATWVLKPLLFFWTTPTWLGVGRIPAAGPVVLAVNHISLADPVAIADLCVYGAGRIPSFLAKASLFRLPAIGALLTGAHQIPVERGLVAGGGALDAAERVLADGGCVVIYPEGGVTRDPQGWPMTGHSGAARLALGTGAPVYPVGQWGAQRLIGSPRGIESRPRPRTRVVAVVGAEIDLSAWRGRPLDTETLTGATEAIMAGITGCVSAVRGTAAPDRPRWRRAA